MKSAPSVRDPGAQFVFDSSSSNPLPNFLSFSYHSGAGADLSNTSVPFPLPGMPGALVTDYPEWCVPYPQRAMITSNIIRSYDSSVSGPSGNVTVNGALTCTDSILHALLKRGEGAGGEQGVNLNAPPYAIHNGALLNSYLL